jgi:hypothetical protein
MEIIVTLIFFASLAGFILSPILLLKIINRTALKYKFIAYLAIGIFSTAFIVLISARWEDKSNMLLLAHYGYNFDGMNENEFYGSVKPENMERVRSLVTSIGGVGWPVKAILTFIFYSPYLLFVYVAWFFFGKLSKRKEGEGEG